MLPPVVVAGMTVECELTLSVACDSLAQVLIYLDAHCEVGVNWYAPLVAPISKDRYRTSQSFVPPASNGRVMCVLQRQGKPRRPLSFLHF